MHGTTSLKIAVFVGFCMLSIAVSGELQDDNLGVVEDEAAASFDRSVSDYPLTHCRTPPKMKSSTVLNILSYITGKYPELLSV